MRNHRLWRRILGLAILALLAAPAASAQDAGNEALRREIDELKRKVEALERGRAAGEGAAVADEDEELRKLREDAEETAEKAPEKPGTAAQPAAGGGGRGAGGSLMQSLNAFNPRMTVFGDFVGRIGTAKTELPQDDRMSIREVELDFRADVDPYAKAVGILALHEEPDAPGTYAIDLEECFVTFEALPLNLRGQLGRWKQRFGQANRIHRHDYMWVEQPLALTDMLGEEGLIENAAGLLWLAPGLPLELEATVMNGENGTILAGPDSDFPAFLGRANLFTPLGNLFYMNLGASGLLGYNDAVERENDTHLLGADALLQWRPHQRTSVVALAEVYYLDRKTAKGGPDEHALGWYGAFQVQPSIPQLYIGARYDWSEYAEQIEDNPQWAASVYASWYTTEFLRIRVGYEHRERRSTGFPGAPRDLDTVFVQVTFVFGSHPVEPFWVNR